MKNKSLLLFTAILWSVSAAIWVGAFCADLYYGYTPEGLMILHILCVLTSLLAAAVNFIRWNNKRNDE